MTVETTLKAVLESDATLLSLATGGVWSWDEAGEKGLNRTRTPAAFDSAGIIKPCIMVNARAANPGYRIQDDTGQVVDVRQVFETYFFDQLGYGTIDSMASRCFTLLHAKQFTGIVRCEWAGSIRLGRDEELAANVVRHDWLCTYIRAGS